MTSRCFLTLIISFALIAMAQVNAASLNQINSNDVPVVIKDTGAFYYFEDKDQVLSAEQDIFQLVEQVNWMPLASDANIPRFTNYNTWFLIPISNPTDLPAEVVLELPVTRVLDTEFWVLSNNVVQHNIRIGSSHPYSERLINSRDFRVPLTLNANEDGYIVIRANEYAFAIIDKLQALPLKDYLYKTYYEEWFEWFIYGALVLLACYNIIIYLVSRRPIYLCYVVLVACIGINILSLRGYGEALIWGDLPWLSMRMDRATSTLSIAAAGFFACNFLQLKNFQPVMYKIILGVSFFLVGLTIVPFVNIDWMRPAHVTGMILIVPVYLLITVCAFRSPKSEVAGANIFGISNAMYVISMLTFSFYISSTGKYAGVANEIAQLITVTLISIALAFRLQDMRMKEKIAVAENEAKSAFLAKMSHEIRTPMNGILGMSELLKNTGLTETQANYNKIIEDSGSTLLHVINDILDYSKIEAGKMDIESIEFDLHSLAIDAIQLIKVGAKNKKIELNCHVRPDVPRVIIGDPSRIKQVLINLLSNALKFTERGSISLLIEKDAENSDQFAITIADTGIGIKEEEQENLFSSFKQADMSIARRYGGTGLGLSISKQLTEIMGGTITFESEAGKGSRFTIHLPLKHALAQPDNSAAIELLKGKRLLLINQPLSFGQAVQTYMNENGLSMDICESVDGCINSIKKAGEENRPYDLIVLSSLMSDRTETEIVDEIINATSNNIPFMVLTYFTTKPADHILNKLNIRSWLERPILPDDFILNSLDALNLKSLGKDKTNKDIILESQRMSPMQIIVAEDNITNQIVISKMLKQLGHQVTIANNGAEAIQLFQQLDCDLILMDCEMPEVDGYSATRTIREIEQTGEHLPIIALTAHALPDRLQECIDSGMDSYLIKPVKLKTLANKLFQYQPSSTYATSEKSA